MIAPVPTGKYPGSSLNQRIGDGWPLQFEGCIDLSNAKDATFGVELALASTKNMLFDTNRVIALL